MRFLRFLVKELILHGILFAILGTFVLTGLYLLSTGASVDEYGKIFLSFFSIYEYAAS